MVEVNDILPPVFHGFSKVVCRPSKPRSSSSVSNMWSISSNIKFVPLLRVDEEAGDVWGVIVTRA